MVNRNLIRGLDLNEQEWEQELAAALEGADPDEIEWGGEDIAINEIVEGRVLRVEGDLVLVDVGYKSEGTIPLNEWGEDEAPPEPGQTVKVLIEDIEDAHASVDEARHDQPQQAQGREDRGLEEGHGDGPRRRRRHRRGHPQDQGRLAGRYRRQRLPAGQPGGYPPPARHRRLHRPHHPVRGAEDRRSPPQHRGQPPRADRRRAGREEDRSCCASWKSASSARAWSRTSPSSAPSSTWAASTACCTSPT